jgi:chemosensory pili system protein ChpC
MSTTTSNDIRGVLIQVAGARLLLPNATIAEVLSFADPEQVENAPDWLLGRIRWRGWQLPLVAFSRLSGIAEEKGGLGSKVVVLKALGGNAKAPFFALLTQGFPRLVTVSRNALIAEDEGGELPIGVRARVALTEDAALLPDLEQVENLIGAALAAAA